MITEMHESVPHSIRLVSARKVAFTFDLNDEANENLRDADVVKRSMAGFMITYSRVEAYSAEYIGDWLVLTVTGTITLPQPNGSV